MISAPEPEPDVDSPTAAPRALLILAGALALGGAIGAVSQFVLHKGFWVWEMPDLAHRFLAAAASAYVVGGLIVLVRRRPADAELLAATVLIYGYPPVAAILIDADLVDWGRPIAWAFVTPAVLVGTLYLLRPGTSRTRGSTQRGAVAAAGTRALLLGLVLAAEILGTLVFVAPRPVDAIGPWGELAAWMVLDHRLVASMLLTIAGGALLALRTVDSGSTQLLVAMVPAYCIVAVGGSALHAADAPHLAAEDRVYIAILTMVGVLAALSARASAEAAPAPPPSPAAR